MSGSSAGEPVRIAVVGFGLIGRAHVQRVRDCPGARLAAIVDPAEAAREAATGLGVPWHPDLDALLATERPDGIVLATPNALHVAGALACIAAGIPVLVEKPLAEDLAGARLITEAARRAAVPVLVGHHRRHSPLIARAREIVASGQLGRIVAVNGLCWFRKPDAYFEAAPWRREPGGGVVLINCIHVVDDLRNLCGDIASVQAFASNASRGFPVEDTAAIVLRFASGALGTLSISDAVSAPWSWEMTSGENPAYPRTAEACYLIGGTEGSLSVPRLESWRHGDERAWFGPLSTQRTVVPDEDPLRLQMLHFRDVVRGSAAPLIDAAEAAKTLEATLAVLAAAEEAGGQNRARPKGDSSISLRP